MLQNQAFISLFSYYLSLLREGAVLEAHYSTQTFAERCVYDAEDDSYCIWEDDIHRITRRMEAAEFFRHIYEKRPALRELLVFQDTKVA